MYGFKLKELKLGLGEEGMLPLKADPKLTIAVNSPDKFPVDPNSAEKEELLHVPGIGPRTVEKIEKARSHGKKFREFKELRKCGVIVKRAAPFLQLDRERQLKLRDFC